QWTSQPRLFKPPLTTYWLPQSRTPVGYLTYEYLTWTPPAGPSPLALLGAPSTSPRPPKKRSRWPCPPSARLSPPNCGKLSPPTPPTRKKSWRRSPPTLKKVPDDTTRTSSTPGPGSQPVEGPHRAGTQPGDPRPAGPTGAH